MSGWGSCLARSGASCSKSLPHFPSPGRPRAPIPPRLGIYGPHARPSADAGWGARDLAAAEVYARLACRRPRSPRQQTYGPSAPLRIRRKVHARATLAAVAVRAPSSLLARRRHERLLLRDHFDPGPTVLRTTLVTTPEASTRCQPASARLTICSSPTARPVLPASQTERGRDRTACPRERSRPARAPNLPRPIPSGWWRTRTANS